MKYIKLSGFPLSTMALILCVFLSCSVSDDKGGSGGGGGDDNFLPVFKGTSSYMDTSISDIVMYQSQTETNLYYISGFFGSEGGLAFSWDKESNLLSVEESNTGLYNDKGPIYVVSQSRYCALCETGAQDSFYTPSSCVFTFNVIFEFAEYDGTIVHLPAMLFFTIQETMPS